MENINCGSVAQLVEQRTENPCVAGSIPARATVIIGLKKHTSKKFLKITIAKGFKNEYSD